MCLVIAHIRFFSVRACVCFTVILIFKKMLARLNFLQMELSEQRSERSPGSLRLSRSACVFQQHLVAKGPQSVTASPSHEGQGATKGKGAAPRRGNRSLLPLVIMPHFLRSVFDDMNHAYPVTWKRHWKVLPLRPPELRTAAHSPPVVGLFFRLAHRCRVLFFTAPEWLHERYFQDFWPTSTCLVYICSCHLAQKYVWCMCSCYRNSDSFYPVHANSFILLAHTYVHVCVIQKKS